MQAPIGYRCWVYVGTPLTLNALNDGEAAFPEFDNIYVEAYPILNPDFPDRSQSHAPCVPILI